VSDLLPDHLDVLARLLAIKIAYAGPMTPEVRRAFRRRVNRYVRQLPQVDNQKFWRRQADE
jgi:hypothetical protein